MIKSIGQVVERIRSIGGSTGPGDGVGALNVAYLRTTDYRRITDVLADIEADIRRSLLDDLERELGEPVEPLLHLLGSWSIGHAREAAWIRAQVLWMLRDVPLLFDQSVAISASATGMTSRHLLTPLLPPNR